MRLSVCRKSASAAAAIAALLMSCPAAAAPVSLRSFAAQQMHLQTIAYRIGTASSAMCANPDMLTGMVLHDLSQYDPEVRPAVARAFSLGAGVGVIQIVPGSAAERAGLRIDDEIVAVDGRSIADPSVYSQARKSYARMERITALLEAALRNGATQLLVRRGGTLMRVTLQADRGCGGELSLIDSGDTNAWSDGQQVAVTTAMAQLANDDDEIAFVIAHEMAHNILGHSRTSSDGIFGFSFGLSRSRQSELAADQLAVRLMSGGGYNPEGGIDFLEIARRRFWWASFSLDHPGFGRRIQVVSAAIAAQQADAMALKRGPIAPPPAPSTAASQTQQHAAATLAVLVQQERKSGAQLQLAQLSSAASWSNRRTNCDR
jgi:S1-C subfamily serine protease